MFSIHTIKADPTTFILQYVQGKIRREGNGLAFWYSTLTTSLVAIPTSSTDIPFIFNEITADFQEISLQGQLTFRIARPKQLAQLMNYTLDPKTRRYLSEDPQQLAHRITTLAQVSLSHQLSRLDLRQALQASSQLVATTQSTLAQSEIIQSLGVEILDLSILALKPTPATARALEAAVREQLLEEADVAINKRRNAAIEQERGIRENELRTELAVQAKQREIKEAEMETKKSLQAQQNQLAQAQLEADIQHEAKRREWIQLSIANDNQQADSRAYAIAALLQAMATTDVKLIEAITAAKLAPEQLMAQAFKELAGHSEHIGQLNITPDLLQALTTHIDTKHTRPARQ